MIAEVFRGLRKRFGERLTLYNPNSIPVSFNNSELIKNLNEIIEMDDEVSSNNDLIEKRLEQISCLLDKSDNENDFREMRSLKRFLEDYQRINKRFESVVSSLGGEVPKKEKDTEKTDANNKEEKPRPNYLAAYLTVENIYRLMRTNDGGFWLEIKAVKAGGTTRIKTNLIVDVFTGGDRVSHSGASIIQYNLYNKSGFSVLSGIVPDYIPYTKPKRIIGLMEPEPERLARTKKNSENKQTADNKRNNAPGKN